MELKAPDADKTAATESAIDWPTSIDDSAWHFDPEYLHLYDTSAWHAMSESERRTYSRHEAASGYRWGIWIENVLVRCLMDQLYELPAQDPAHKFLYLETAEECRHSAMFAEFIKRAGTPDYTPTGRIRFMGMLLEWTGIRIVHYLSILAGEEIADAYDRANSRSPRTHPVSKRMATLHVIDEAAHMAFARETIAKIWTTQDPVRRWLTRWYLPIVVYTLIDGIVHPSVYETLRIRDGYRLAWDNAHRRERFIRDLKPYTEFLIQIGVITPFYRRVWRAAGLLA